MKILFFVLSLVASGSAFADYTLTEEQNDIIMSGVCEAIVSNYALGSGWDDGYKNISVAGISSVKSKEGLALTVDTWKTEDMLMSPGPKYSYFCYRCDDGNFKAAKSGSRAQLCQ